MISRLRAEKPMQATINRRVRAKLLELHKMLAGWNIIRADVSVGLDERPVMELERREITISMTVTPKRKRK